MVEVAKPKKLKIHQSFSVESGMVVLRENPTLVKVCEGQDDVFVVVVVVVVAVLFWTSHQARKK